MLRLLEFYSRFKKYILFMFGAIVFIVATFKAAIKYLLCIKDANEDRDGIKIGERDEHGFIQVPVTPSVPKPEENPIGVDANGKATLGAEGKLEPVPVEPPKDEKPQPTTKDLIDKVNDILNNGK